MFIMIIWVLGWFIAGFLGGWLCASLLKKGKSFEKPSIDTVGYMQPLEPTDNVQFIDDSLAKEQLEQATSLKDLI